MTESLVAEPQGGCLITPAVILCRPRYLIERRVLSCPTCEARRRFAVMVELWYGNTKHCLSCGDVWQDGYLLARPFRRGWREQRLQKAREMWAEGLSPREFRRALGAWMGSEFRDDDTDEDPS